MSCEPSVLPLSATMTSARDAIFVYRPLRFLDTFGERVGLVQAGDDYAEFDF